MDRYAGNMDRAGGLREGGLLACCGPPAGVGGEFEAGPPDGDGNPTRTIAAGRIERRTMEKPKIIAYLKPWCGWSNGVRAVLKKHDLPFEDRDIINDPVQRAEMIEKSGQTLSPCVEVNGTMLADVSGDEVEAWMLKQGIVQPTSRPADAPTNQPCAHELPQPTGINFRRQL